MAKIKEIQDIILGELKERAANKAANLPLVERQLVVDAKRTQFILLSVGWQEAKYIHQCLIHIQIKGKKIWIHEDLTDPGVYESLIENNIPPSSIVLGFVSELERSGSRMIKTA